MGERVHCPRCGRRAYRVWALVEYLCLPCNYQFLPPKAARLLAEAGVEQRKEMKSSGN